MNRSRIVFAVGAAALLLLAGLLLLPLGPVPSSAGPAPSPAAAPAATVASDPAYYSELSTQLARYGAGDEIGPLGELPLSVVRAFLSVNLAPASSQAEIAAVDSAAFSAASDLQVAFSWTSLLAAAAGGCVGGAIVGGLIGSAAAGVGALPGAGIGCAAGAVAGAFGDYLGQLQQASNTNKETFQTEDAAAANEMRLVNQEGQAVGALLPATSYFWYRLADVAAMNQIGNSTFNATLDLEQSTLFSQLGTISSALLGQANDVVSVYSQFADQNGNPLGIEATTCAPSCNVVLGPADALVGLSGTSPIWTTPGSIWSTFFYGLTGNAGCPTGYSVGTTARIEGSASVSTTACTSGYNSNVDATTVLISGVTSGSGAITETNSSESGVNIVPPGPWTTDALPYCVVSPCATYSVTDAAENVYDTVTGAYALSTVSLVNVTNVMNQIAGIELNAVGSGQTYYSYLRDLGYTNPATIPAKFQILPPAEVMPQSLCLDNVSIFGGTSYTGTCANLNYTEFNSLYLAWLASLARFFNSTTYQQGPSPCPSAGACATWGNLNEYGTGDVYVPGAKSSSGGTESFGNVSTWNVTRSQLLFFPQVVPESIPVGKVWEVPSNGPLEVYVVQEGELLSLAGNGTAVAQATGGSGFLAAAATAGDAIYLNTCTYDGGAAAACNVQPYTVNITIEQLLCSANSSACPSPPSTIFGGPPNLICGILGAFGVACSGPLGVIAQAVMLLLIVALVAVAIYAVYAVARGNRRGGGGSTIVVTGGR